MSPQLNHLSKEQIDALIERYYTSKKDSPSKLVEEYQINISPNSLYKLFPNLICKEECPYCGVHLQEIPYSRSAQKDRRKHEPFCPNCFHKSTGYCMCENCKKKREQAKAQKIIAEETIIQKQRRKIQETYKFNSKNRISKDTLTFRDKVFLASVLRDFLSEDFSTIGPVDLSSLSPTLEMSCDILKILYRKKIFMVDSSSDINAFDQEDDFPNTYYVGRVKYILNLKLPTNTVKLIKELLHPSFTKTDQQAALALWEEIAVNECIEYLLLQLDKINFPFSAGKKTYEMFEELVHYFSVGQIYSIIWRKVSDAARLYQEGNLTKQHAANTVISGCRSFGERARINKWELTPYSRPKELVQSSISQVFYNQVLKIGEKGFQLPPSLFFKVRK